MRHVGVAAQRLPLSAPGSPRADHLALFAGPRSYGVLLVVLVGTGIAVVLVAVSVGAVSVPLGVVWRSVAGNVGIPTGAVAPVQDQIVWDLRVPRVLLGGIVGAGLSIAGTVIQAVVRNPLGDPYLLGIIPGASVGAVLVIVAGLTAAMGLSLSAAAFVGAMAAFVITFALSRQDGQWPATRLVLSGVAVGYLFTSVTFFLQVLASPNEVQRVLFWTLGSVAGARWPDLAVPGVAVVVMAGWLLLQGRRLNALSMGTEVAGSLGIDVGRFQVQLMVVVAVLTGTVVAVAGGIGFVGLVIPHIARLLVGADHRRVLVTSTMLGAVFLVAVDVLARVVVRPAELPIGVLTAAVGAPFLLWLLRRQGLTRRSRS